MSMPATLKSIIFFIQVGTERCCGVEHINDNEIILKNVGIIINNNKIILSISHIFLLVVLLPRLLFLFCLPTIIV